MLLQKPKRVEEELNKFTPQNETQLANKLSALGTLKQKVRDYHSAIDLYNQSLHVREKMGEKESSGYALVLYLKSISEFRQGKYCPALENIKNVISIYQKIGESILLSMRKKKPIKSTKKLVPSIWRMLQKQNNFKSRIHPISSSN